MLLGESGVGKELVARTIHRNSPRDGQRFIQVNCAAIPEELIESELFGHEKGSFTGATEKQIGKFEQADRGTIFLDEVGDMSPKTQAKVLRVLQEQEVERLGSARTIKVDVRVIAATNKNLEEAIERGEFREDLYFRLNVIPIVVPPLRERREDIPLLVQHFAQRIERGAQPQTEEVRAAAMEALQRYRWRGNIRELRNTVERLMIMTPADVVRVEDLPAEIRSGGRVRRGRRPLPRQPRRAAPRTGAEADGQPPAPARCASSRTLPSVRISCRSCARTTGTSRRPPRSSTRRAAISTRSSSSTASSRKSTDNGSVEREDDRVRVIELVAAGQTTAACPETAALPRSARERKVRTPQGSAPGNARAGQPDGQWHRKNTALSERSARGVSRRVRVKRCGKSAPRRR